MLLCISVVFFFNFFLLLSSALFYQYPTVNGYLGIFHLNPIFLLAKLKIALAFL